MNDSTFLVNWRCPRCECSTFTTGQARVSGGFASSLFDVQGKKFVTVECEGCGYTEFYKRRANTAGKILDFFTN